MSEWIDVAPTGEFVAGERRVVEVDGVPVIVLNVDGEFHAVEDVCTHDQTPLSDGEIIDREIICPRHGARFCLRTGKALCPPAYEPIAVFAVRVEGGVVQIRDHRTD